MNSKLILKFSVSLQSLELIEVWGMAMQVTPRIGWVGEVDEVGYDCDYNGKLPAEAESCPISKLSYTLFNL